MEELEMVRKKRVKELKEMSKWEKRREEEKMAEEKGVGERK